MKIITAILVTMFIGLQIRLWSDDGGMKELELLRQKVAEQTLANEQLKLRNQSLLKQVNALRDSDLAIEQYARLHLGMIKPGETFYRFVPPKSP